PAREDRGWPAHRRGSSQRGTSGVSPSSSDGTRGGTATCPRLLRRQSLPPAPDRSRPAPAPRAAPPAHAPGRQTGSGCAPQAALPANAVVGGQGVCRPLPGPLGLSPASAGSPPGTLAPAPADQSSG